METAQSRPRFRTDLVAQPIDEAGQRFIDVTDPDSGTTFRFYEVEYSIACAMDGRRDVMGLSDWAADELGIVPRPSREELERVISTLDDLGYLASNSTGAGADVALGHAGVSDTLAPVSEMVAGGNVELGFAGNASLDSSADMPSAPDIGLGHAGNEGVSGEPLPGLASTEGLALLEEDDDEPTSMLKRDSRPTPVVDLPPPPVPGGEVEPMATLRPTGRADSDEDGPTALPGPVNDLFDEEVSVDLTDHLKLGPDAIKEAVRQSKMIPAVEPPPAGPAEAPEPAAPAVPEQRPQELPATPAPSVSMPLEPPARHSAPVQIKRSNAGVLIIVLLVVIIGALIAEYYLGIIGLRQMMGLENPPQPQAVVEQPVKKEPPSPKPPQAALIAVAGPTQEVLAPVDGTLAFVVESGTVVQEEAVVAKFKGFERVETKIRGLEERLDVYQIRLEKATAAKEARAIKYNQAKVDQKKAGVVEEEQELDKFLIKAPIAGTVDTALKSDDRVKADQAVLSIKLPATLQATFTMPGGLVYEQDAEVELIAGDRTVACTVIEVEGPNVTVDCPSGTGIEADTQVTLPLPG